MVSINRFFGKAPELNGVVHWFNTKPLAMKALKGKVVLVDFWTYSCINCLRTLPHMKALWEKYKERVEKGEPAKKVLVDLGFDRYCCRALFLGHVDLIDTVAQFKKV